MFGMSGSTSTLLLVCSRYLVSGRACLQLGLTAHRIECGSSHCALAVQLFLPKFLSFRYLNCENQHVHVREMKKFEVWSVGAERTPMTLYNG